MKSTLLGLGLGGLLLAGCSSWNVLAARSQSPEVEVPPIASAQLVGDLAVEFGMYPIRVEAVGLVTGLAGTGSDPPPSPQRALLIEEMQRIGVPTPNAVLASDTTSLVVVQGFLRPGIQKGDRFDLEVRIPARSETTSLRGGWLMESRLKTMALLDNQIRSGELLGFGQGPVLVDPSAGAGQESVWAARGRVLGGGVALRSRPVGLVLKPGFQHEFNAARIANAINRRFHTYRNGIQMGVATAKTDKYVELSVHPRYRDNVERYLQVVRAVVVRESEVERLERIALLEKQLMEPITAAHAARQLEALGNEGVETLRAGIESNNAEVRFFASEALAYLDRREAAEPLRLSAQNEPAFRVFALAALGTMNDVTAYDALRELLEVPSAETRYGAFRALRAMNPRDNFIRGESFGPGFHYHVLDVPGPPMVHITRNRRPELVVFGRGIHLTPPFALEAGNSILVVADGAEVRVSRYAVGEADQRRLVSTDLDDIVRAVVDLGGTYPDVVQALQQAKASGALAVRFEVEAVPGSGRSYDRLAEEPAPVEEPSRWRWNPLGRVLSRIGGGGEEASPPDAERREAAIAEEVFRDEEGTVAPASYEDHE